MTQTLNFQSTVEERRREAARKKRMEAYHSNREERRAKQKEYYEKNKHKITAKRRMGYRSQVRKKRGSTQFNSVQRTFVCRGRFFSPERVC